MLSIEDQHYAYVSALDWIEQNESDRISAVSARGFAHYFKSVCVESGSLDHNIPSLLRVWREDRHCDCGGDMSHNEGCSLFK